MEYIHSKGYIHADIKGANILLGASKETSNQCYLVDFGLACHYTTNKEFKPDPKKAHDGTIEYLSRDAHHGGKFAQKISESSDNIKENSLIWIFSSFFHLFHDTFSQEIIKFAVPTRRGDIEILLYNLIHWLGGVLPWEKCLTNPVSVQESKEKHMKTPDQFLKTCFGSKPVPSEQNLLYNFLLIIY